MALHISQNNYKMKVELIRTTPLQVNTYFLIKDNKCLLVDPGGNEDKIINYINKQHLDVVGIILTHAHFDHFGACNKLNSYYNLPLYVHQGDVPLLNDPFKNLSAQFNPNCLLKIDENINIETLVEKDYTIGDFNFHVYHIPGHSPGGICLYFKDEGIVITGDSLFRRSIGRTDFPNSNNKQLLNNIQSKLFKLPDGTICYPGHGDETTIGEEKRSNPYIK